VFFLTKPTDMDNSIFSVREKIQFTPLLSNLCRKFSVTKHLISCLFFILFLPKSFLAQCPSGSSGSGFLNASMCAPASVAMYYEFISLTELPQTSYRVQFIWGDGTARNITQPVQTRIVAGQTVWYVRVELSHTYPSTGLCEYVVLMVLYNSSGVQCQDSRQTQIVANWHQDNIATANGIIALDPIQKNVCEGLPLIDFQFADVSNFACNIRDFPLAQKPDHMPRHEQFIYGTNPVAGRGIPDLFIKAGTAETLVRLTDAGGSPVPNIWTVDPLTGGTVAPYSTASGFFEGPVVTIPVDAVTGEYSLNKTFKISYNGTGTDDQDQFQVTVRNWNTCNPWNGSQTNPNGGDANTAVSKIIISSGPVADAGADGSICSDGIFKTHGLVTDATSSIWTTTGDGFFTSPEAPGNAVYNPGSNDIYTGFVDLVLHAFKPAGDCPENTDTMRLEIRRAPDVFAITMGPGADTICNAMPLTINVESWPAETGARYTWTVSATPGIAGATDGPPEGVSFNSDIVQILNNFTPELQMVVYTITGFIVDSEGTLVCSGIPYVKVIWVLPHLQLFTSGSSNICSGEETNLHVGTSYPELFKIRYTWTVNAPPEIIGAENGPENLEDWMKLDVPINQVLTNLSFSPRVVRYELRGYLKAGGGTICPPEQVSIAEVTVNPSGQVNKPDDRVVCSGNLTLPVNFSTVNTGVTTAYVWTNDLPAIGLPASGTGDIPSFVAVNTGTDPVAATITVTPIIKTDGTNCPGVPKTFTITVYPEQFISIQPLDYTICQGDDASFSAEASGTSLTWQWEVDKGEGFIPVMDDPLFSGTATNMLTITGTPAFFNGWIFRARVNGICGAPVYTGSAKLTVNTNPVVDFTASDPVEVTAGVPIILNGNPTGGSGIWTQHLWTGDARFLNNTTIQSPTFISDEVGIYSLTYRVTDNNSCNGEDNLSVVVKVLTGEEVIPGIKGSVSLYPNPSASLIRLRIGDYDIGDLRYQVIGLTGILFREEIVEDKEIDISLEELDPGIYFLRLIDNNKVIGTCKIVKN